MYPLTVFEMIGSVGDVVLVGSSYRPNHVFGSGGSKLAFEGPFDPGPKVLPDTSTAITTSNLQLSATQLQLAAQRPCEGN